MTTPEPAFLPGLDLSRVLYEDAVRPLLERELPAVRHTAARLGGGSEVLGFDTARSADHEWGPRLEVFLSPADAAAHGPRLRRVLAERLPKEVRGWPTHFTESTDPLDPSGLMARTDGPVNHRVSVLTVSGFLTEQLGTDPSRRPLTTSDWLAIPQQRLAETTAGAVLHDGLGELGSVREELAWYPEEVWRYLLACGWQRISQEEAFVGRCAEVGDDLGSAVVAARLVRDLMRLSLLLERRYAPYGKWLGSAFAQLAGAAELGPLLQGALAATTYAARERCLCEAYELVGARQNATGLAPRVDPTRRLFHARPFLVLHAERFADALRRTLTDPVLCALPLTGGADQWGDSTDLLGRPEVVRAMTDELIARS